MTKTCAHCGREFRSDHADARRRNCSPECRRAYGYQQSRSPEWHLRVFYTGFVPGPGCWLWTRSATRAGYPTVRWEGRNQLAHRISHVLHNGPIPEGYQVDHKCRQPLCVNPAHLEAVTPKENTHRSNSVSMRCYRRARGLPEIVPPLIGFAS